MRKLAWVTAAFLVALTSSFVVRAQEDLVATPEPSPVGVSVASDVPLLVTVILSLLIVGVSLYGYRYRKLASQRKHTPDPVVILIPGAVISLGIFGTFLGIFLGLREFNTDDINASIPSLLDGLKTAFVTSLFGMSASLILKWQFSLFDKSDATSGTEAQSDDPVELLAKVVEGMTTLNNTVTGIGDMVYKCFRADDDFSLVSQLKLIRTDMSDLRREVVQSLNEFAEKIAEMGTAAIIEALKEVIEDFNAKLNDLVGDEFKQLKEAMIKLVEWQERHREAVDTMQGQLSLYLTQVETAATTLERASTSLTGAAGSLGSISDHLDSIDGSLSQISISASALERAVTAIGDQNVQLKTLLEQIRSIGEEAAKVLPTINTQLKELTEKLSTSVLETNDSIEETLEKSTERITKDLDTALTTSLTSHGEQLATLSNKFVEDYTPLTDRLREVVRLSERADSDEQ